METINKYLTDIDSLVETINDGKSDYIQPKLKNLGSVSVVLLREIIAPTVFRNSDAEITDINVNVAHDRHVRLVRAVPNKFKHKERSRGTQILRLFEAGGRFPQNRHEVSDQLPTREIFDLNSLVFGDSVNQGKRVLPVKSSVLYSDGLSLDEYLSCTDRSFHVSTPNEYGTLFDITKSKNTDKLFERYYVVPGTQMVQVVSTHGKVLPKEGFDHLLMSLGYAGAYGGQTAVTGVNVRTHIVGVYASKLEQPETSSFEIARHILSNNVSGDLSEMIAQIDAFVAPSHEDVVRHEEVTSYQSDLLDRLRLGDEQLREMYQRARVSVGGLFEAWFDSQAANSKKKEAA